MIFALEAVLPFVFMLACGYFLKRRGILTENFRQQGDALCFRFLFPVLVFQNIYTAEMPETSIWRPIWFAIGVMVSSLLIFWLAVPRLEKDHRKIPVIIQSLYRGNFMIYGIPFSLRLGGEEAALIATAMTAVTLPLLNIAAIATYARYTEGEKVQWKDTVMQILKNPIIWG
ncbi:AEC family transporter, partial [Anaerotignum lactatifermentans]